MVRSSKLAPWFFTPGIWILGLLLIFLGSCSQAEPTIDAVTLRLVYRQTEEGIQERLTLLVAATDDDGQKDLAELHLIHDTQQLVWTLHDSDWINTSHGGRSWFGSHSIAMSQGEKFPRGAYRIVLIDKGGARSERTLGFNAPENPDHSFPTLTISVGNYAVTSEYPSNSLVFYDNRGAKLNTLLLTEKNGMLKDLKIPEGARTAALWVEDPDRMVAALTALAPLQ